jgi:hypothetical protein
MPKRMETHRRCRDWEAFDKIELEVVPRYKTSGLSGDEWRTGVAIRFFHKGHLVHEDFRTRMEYAIMMLGDIWVKAQEPIPEKVIRVELEHCDQPGCKNLWIGKRFLKRIAAREGWLDPENTSFRYFRRFCDKHLKRGDCGLEDADRNYELEGGDPS